MNYVIKAKSFLSKCEELVNNMSYIIKAQGYEPSGRFATKAEAITEIRKAVADDLKACRSKFGAAVLKKWKNEVWEVAVNHDRHAPMWSRYSLHVS